MHTAQNTEHACFDLHFSMRKRFGDIFYCLVQFTSHPECPLNTTKHTNIPECATNRPKDKQRTLKKWLMKLGHTTICTDKVSENGWEPRMRKE